MNHSVYRMSLDIHDMSSQVSISVKRGDTCRRIVAVLTENGKPYSIAEGCTAVFRAKKPMDSAGNRAIVFNDCTIEGNAICYTLTAENTEITGIADCEFSLYDANGQLLTSPHFTVVIDNTVNTDQEVETEGSAEVSALTALVSETTALKNTIESKLENGEFVGEKGEKGEPGVSPTIEKAEGFQFSEDYNEPNTYTYGTVTTIKPDSYSGININDGAIQVAPATESDIYGQVISMGVDDYGINAPIVPKTVNYAVKMGLVYNHLTFTDEEKAAARNLIGVKNEIHFKPYTNTSDILTDAALVGDGELYVLWVGADKTMFYYGAAITMLGSCELLRFTVVNGAITGMARLGSTNAGVLELQGEMGDVSTALDSILAMQEALIGGGA